MSGTLDVHVNFTGFLSDLVNEKSIVVLNKSDLGIKSINANLNMISFRHA